jgi:hypothetical protein
MASARMAMMEEVNFILRVGLVGYGFEFGCGRVEENREQTLVSITADWG